jgi:hypothetical protein
MAESSNNTRENITLVESMTTTLKRDHFLFAAQVLILDTLIIQSAAG